MAGRYPFLVPLFTVVLAMAAIAGGLLATAWAGHRQTAPTTFLLFLAVLLVTGFLHVEFQYRDEVVAIDLFEAVLVPSVLVLSGVEVVFAVGLSVALSDGLMRIQPVNG